LMRQRSRNEVCVSSGGQSLESRISSEFVRCMQSGHFPSYREFRSTGGLWCQGNVRSHGVGFLGALCGCSQRTQRSKAFTAEIAKGFRRGRRENQMAKRRSAVGKHSSATGLPLVLLPEVACCRDRCSSRSTPTIHREFRVRRCVRRARRRCGRHYAQSTRGGK